MHWKTIGPCRVWEDEVQVVHACEVEHHIMNVSHACIIDSLPLYNTIVPAMLGQGINVVEIYIIML